LLCVGLSKNVDVSGVLATGRPLAVDAKVAVPAFGSYTFPEPGRIALEIDRVDRNLGVCGTIDIVAAGACDRCLCVLERPVHIDVDECLAPNDDVEGELADSNVLHGAQLDVADLARQLVDSALPMLLLCSDDCPGLCPSCGLSRREVACACPPSVER